MTWAQMCNGYFVRIPLPFELIFFWQQCNKMYKLASKRLLFCCYLPCSKDSEKDRAVVQTKLEQHVLTVFLLFAFLLFAAHAGIEKIGSFITNIRDWWSRCLLYNSCQCLGICNVLALATTPCSLQYGYQIFMLERKCSCDN